MTIMMPTTDVLKTVTTMMTTTDVLKAVACLSFCSFSGEDGESGGLHRLQQNVSATA
jgi:hypothetical protein